MRLFGRPLAVRAVLASALRDLGSFAGGEAAHLHRSAALHEDACVSLSFAAPTAGVNAQRCELAGTAAGESRQ